jgi:hypothetical protein
MHPLNRAKMNALEIEFQSTKNVVDYKLAEAAKLIKEAYQIVNESSHYEEDGRSIWEYLYNNSNIDDIKEFIYSIQEKGWRSSSMQCEF